MTHTSGLALCLLVVLGACSLTLPADGAAAAPALNAGDYPTLDDAVGALPPEGGTVLLPPGRFELKKTLNLSWARHKGPQFSVNLRGAGKLATVVLLDTDRQPGIDFTGNSYWTVSDLHLMNRSANVGVLLARTPPGANGCSGEFRNVYFSGCFPVAAVYMTGAECCRFVNCTITNQLKKQRMAGLGYTAANTCWPDDQPYVFMRFARLVDSVIEPAMFCTLRFREDAAGKPILQDSFSCGDVSTAIRARWRLASLGDGCHGNRITSSLPGQVDLSSEATRRNVVTVLNPEP